MPIGACGPTSSYRMDPFVGRADARRTQSHAGQGPRGQGVPRSPIEPVRKGLYLVVTGRHRRARLQNASSPLETIALYPDLGAGSRSHRARSRRLPRRRRLRCRSVANLYGDLDELDHTKIPRSIRPAGIFLT
ncbi:MAG: hypothetical protein MZU97_18385 [Bacillus subtilis]|nr:hypothetical protein [Bacillus subtilis]